MAQLTCTAYTHVQGYRALLSSPWYLNLGVFDGSDWLTYYNVEPLAWKVSNCSIDAQSLPGLPLQVAGLLPALPVIASVLGSRAAYWPCRATGYGGVLHEECTPAIALD